MPLPAALCCRMSVTGGIILLSSSPPRFFAPLPTPVDNPSSSPALPSPGAIFASQRSKASQQNKPCSRQIQVDWLDGHRRFKTTSTPRECCGNGAGLLKPPPLREKREQENLPISKRLPKSKIGDKNGSGEQTSRQSIGRDNDNEDWPTKQNASTPLKNTHDCRSQKLSPLRLDKAPPRKLDWTPPATRTNEGCPGSAAASFSENLRGSFGYNAASHGPNVFEPIKSLDDGVATKRRKLDVVDTGISAPATAMAAVRLLPKTSKSSNEPTRHRVKSPKKKYTTITGLATASYFGAEVNEASPIMQYLSATQQRELEDDFDSIPNTARRKPTVKKSKPGKKAPRRSALLSPQSAMKALEGQDTLFGSASQLARDESPSFTRDTVEAIKHSDKNLLMSDPVSTQISIPASDVPQTPKRHDRRGVSRFAKSRNLWSAAGRDDDNALLQVDTVDMFDSPDIRTAFAGKDVLLEPGAPRFRDSISAEKLLEAQKDPRRFSGNDARPSPVLRGDDMSRSCDTKSLMSIDRLALESACAARTSKVPLQVRALHSTAVRKVDTSQADVDHKEQQKEPPGRGSNPPPTRPSYQGFTTSQLASQLAAFGFKPVKKRQKMIDVLDRCWDEKIKSVSRLDSETTSALDKALELSHGDFLTKVHDVSARPTPKITKPRGRPKIDGTSSSQKPKARKTLPEKSSGEEIKAAKDAREGKRKKAAESDQTRVRKAKDVTTALSATSHGKKTVRVRRKSQKASLSKEPVLDVDDIEDDDDGFGHDAVEDLGNNTGVKPAGRGRAHSLPPGSPSSDAFETASWLSETTVAITSRADEPKATRPPPPSPPPPPPSAIPAIAAATKSHATPQSVITTPSSLSPSQPPPLPDQITLAITTFQRPRTSSIHNSKTTPTFHEKILMYDPIVLEDLAAWLNTEGFKAIGEDREVGPIEVRGWCEERGVCCLWRGGWRGNNDTGVRGQTE
jgi:Slx4 endonuclease